MFVCCECCVLSGRGLCDELITRPEESYRLWCAVVCDVENLKNDEGHDPRWVAAPQQKKKTNGKLPIFLPLSFLAVEVFFQELKW
jgi:hypothetical protein